MTNLPIVLKWADYVLIAGGGLVMLGWLRLWWGHHFRDPLRGSPIRANDLTPAMICICIAAHLVGAMTGTSLAHLTAPAGLQDAAWKAWEGLVAANYTQVIVSIVCLTIASRAFLSGWKGLGIGRRSFSSEATVTLAGLLTAFCVCGLILVATEQFLRLFLPQFKAPEHSVLTTLADDSVTPWMKMVAIGGAVVLAPIGEEVFFRGILQTSLKRVTAVRWGSMRHRWFAIGLSALLFGLMHSPVPHHVPALIVLGVLLGYLYERYGSLLIPIGVHFLFNSKSLIWYKIASASQDAVQ